MQSSYWLHWLVLAGWLGSLAWSGPLPASRLEYTAQAGDSLEAVARRFGVPVQAVLSTEPLPSQGLINPGQVLLIPAPAGVTPALRLLPDSELVYGPSAAGFLVAHYLEIKGGFLDTYREYMGSTAWTPAAEAIQRVAIENSVNPRLLLALLEWECHCVLGPGSDNPGRAQVQAGYALGVEDFHYQWLYRQLSWAANQLSIGYYGWRNGSLLSAKLPNGIRISAGPASNAGSVALEYYFARLAVQKALQRLPTTQQSGVQLAALGDDWRQALDPETGFPALYQKMFGDVWSHDAAYGPLFRAGFQQPVLQLPFEPGRLWSFTSGPHKAWETDGALAALDFAPATADTGCLPTDAWVAAVAGGTVTRSEFGIVVEDLADEGLGQSDGWEETGWAILYMHIAEAGRVPAGTVLRAGERVGQPSCEGGPATGTHVHIARKYNGEWMDAGGAIPFVLSGWTTHQGAKPMEGTLTQAGRVVTAHVYGNFETKISLPANPPANVCPRRHSDELWR